MCWVQGKFRIHIDLNNRRLNYSWVRCRVPWARSDQKPVWLGCDEMLRELPRRKRYRFYINCANGRLVQPHILWREFPINKHRCSLITAKRPKIFKQSSTYEQLLFVERDASLRAWPKWFWLEQQDPWCLNHLVPTLKRKPFACLVDPKQLRSIRWRLWRRWWRRWRLKKLGSIKNGWRVRTFKEEIKKTS